MNNVMQTHLSIRDGHDPLAGIRSKLPGVFTPSLPPELWLQIFRLSIDFVSLIADWAREAFKYVALNPTSIFL